MNCQIVILAAGNGTRMRSDTPKVLHKVGNKSMLQRVVNNCLTVTKDLILVHSKSLLPYLDEYSDICRFVLQDVPLGTAHAVYSAIDQIKKDIPIAVIYADNPFISPDLITDLFDYLNKEQSAIVTLAFNRQDPAQYGRIIVDQYGNFIKIVEHKYATEEEKTITLCNSGVMVFAPNILNKYLNLCITPNTDNQKEFYLTKIIEICSKKEKISCYVCDDDDLVIGVNTQEELNNANIIVNKRS